MGPTGKMVCLSHLCWARWHLSSPLMCCCVLLLSRHRVSKGCREMWEALDLLVNLWVCLLSFTVCVTVLILCICLFQTLFIIMFLSSSSSQGAIGKKGPVGPAGKPGARVSTLAATVHQTADSSSMYSRKPLEREAEKLKHLWIYGPPGCCFTGISARIEWGEISHEVYFHSKGRLVRSRLNEPSVLLAFLRQSVSQWSKQEGHIKHAWENKLCCEHKRTRRKQY